MENILQEIKHLPYGIEHPYRQGPEERSPRDPQERQPVSIGITTSPPGAAERVLVEWSADGGKSEISEGQPVSLPELDDDAWAASLPAFHAGQKVTYRVKAAHGDQTLEAGPYTITITGWKSLGDVLSCQLSSEGVELTVACPGLEKIGRISLDLQAQDQVGVTLSLEADTNGKVMSSPPCNPLPSQHAGDSRVLESTAEQLVLQHGNLRLVVGLRPYRLSILDNAGKQFLKETAPPAWLVGEAGHPLAFRQAYESPQNEGFYGFGERFTAFNQRGNRLDVRVFEQFFAEGKRTYIPMPYFLSSQGYGHHIHTTRCVKYDLASKESEHWSYQAEVGADGKLSSTIMIGTPQTVVRSFTSQTGLPTLPPSWAFGPWMSGNEWNSQARVMEELQKTLDLNIPTTVLVIEAWSDESTFYIWNDAEYEPKPSDQPFKYSDFTFPEAGRWPDPKGMIDRLHELGIRLVLWQIPVMKKLDAPHPQHNIDEAYMLEKGCCVQNEDGTPYRIRPFWFHDAMLMDFTNPEAARWWLDKRAYLIDELGVDGFKTDGGEHLWSRDARFHNGMRGAEAWNLYPNLYVGAYYNFITEKKGGDALTFSRAGYTGAQAYPMHWAGDEYSTWETLQEAIIASLNAGLSGIPFLGWDIAGFSGEIPTAELYLRSTAMAAFCPVMQYHSDFNHHRTPKRDRTPWNIAERTGSPEVIDIYRGYAHLRMRLLPYIESEASHCAKTGEPLMRPLLLDWPEDPETWKITDQYCFGRALLVAPVIMEGQRERKLYLPAGEWQDLWNGQVVQGGQWIEREAPVHVIPVYRRMDIDFIDLKMDIG
jgi:alpha-glucosidase (family GH31 glycosyl hydrolase)